MASALLDLNFLNGFQSIRKNSRGDSPSRHGGRWEGLGEFLALSIKLPTVVLSQHITNMQLPRHYSSTNQVPLALRSDSQILILDRRVATIPYERR